MNEPRLAELTMPGLHDFVVEQVLSRFGNPGGRAIDLGAGTGALAVRMQGLGWEVMAADRNASEFKAPLRFQIVDLSDPAFSEQLGEGQFSLVTAVEVIEHVESPIGFLRNARRLLKPKGRIVVTTPNLDSVPARVKFLLSGKIRMMDEAGEPTHISPLFWDLLNRQVLPLAGLRMQEHYLYPANGYLATRPRYSWIMRGLSGFLGGECKFGDAHVMVLQRKDEQ